jgi:hypothetical protein
MHITVESETLLEKATAWLQKLPALRKKQARGEHADEMVAVQIAAHVAERDGKDAFVIPGNSYGHAVLRVFFDMRDGIVSSVTRPAAVFRVTPKREVYKLHLSYSERSPSIRRNPYPNEHAARVLPPTSIRPDTYRSKTIKAGIRLILGKLKRLPLRKPKSGTGSRVRDPMVVQAVRFSNALYTAAQARSWLAKHGIRASLEPATASRQASMRAVHRRRSRKPRSRGWERVA